MNYGVIRGETSRKCNKEVRCHCWNTYVKLEAAVRDGGNQQSFRSRQHLLQQQSIIPIGSKCYLSTGVGFYALRKARTDTNKSSPWGKVSCRPQPMFNLHHLAVDRTNCAKRTCWLLQRTRIYIFELQARSEAFIMCSPLSSFLLTLQGSPPQAMSTSLYPVRDQGESPAEKMES